MLRAPGVTLPAPRSLHALVGSRLTACTADAESLVVAAAVLGADCDLADAAALAGLDDPLPALQEAIGQRLLAEQPAAGRRRIAFPHALIRAAVYQDIGVARRAALHRAAAGRPAAARLSRTGWRAAQAPTAGWRRSWPRPRPPRAPTVS